MTMNLNFPQMEGAREKIDKSALRELGPSVLNKAVRELLRGLDERSVRVISWRFGLDNGKAKTLQAIGEFEGVTRERVRQVEQSILRSLKKELSSAPQARKTADSLAKLLNNLGGAARKDVLDELAELSKEEERAKLGLLLELLEDVKEARESQRFWSHYRQKRSVPVERIIGDAEARLEKQNKLMEDRELLDLLCWNKYKQVGEPALRSVLSIARRIVYTPFKQWGLRDWPEALPKGVGDKAYVIMKRKGEPLHFTTITELINSTNFDSRSAHPQTVHNELIRDERFVLVGRGLYALQEWGYIQGTVSDILQRALEKSGVPMLKEELVESVLKERVVKRNTILLALQNKERFARAPEGKYVLASAAGMDVSGQEKIKKNKDANSKKNLKK